MKAALIKLNFAVFLWGFTGVLGKAIQLNEGLLVWYRLLITVVTLFLLMLWRNELKKITLKTVLKLAAIGCIVALHWVCFYGSIKYANVSIALICLSAAGVLTALIEPIFISKKIVVVEVLLGFIAIIGIYLIFHFDTKYRIGILIGFLSTILSVLFSVLNKKIVDHVPPKTMILFELSGGLLFLSLLMPLYLKHFPVSNLLPTFQDWMWLIILSWICTIWAFDLSLQALKKISAFTQNLTLNLEPVYGIVLAFFVYQENKYLNFSFYIGFILILLAVVLQMLRIVLQKKV
jgi:drug/metabolite transporter (DMT)-like permease